VTDHAHQPGPGRSTSEAAFADLKKEIAQRNDQAQKEARKIRTARELEEVRRRRQADVHSERSDWRAC
jgi:hypothetical protein